MRVGSRAMPAELITEASNDTDTDTDTDTDIDIDNNIGTSGDGAKAITTLQQDFRSGRRELVLQALSQTPAPTPAPATAEPGNSLPQAHRTFSTFKSTATSIMSALSLLKISENSAGEEAGGEAADATASSAIVRRASTGSDASHPLRRSSTGSDGGGGTRPSKTRSHAETTVMFGHK